MEELKTVYDLLVELQRVTIKNNKLLQEIEKIKERAACAASPRYGFDKTSRTTTSTEDQWIHFIEEKTELEKAYRRNERRKKGLLRWLFKELQYLNEASRVTLVLWYVEDQTTRELAEKLGKSEATVRKMLERARIQARQLKLK